MPVKLTPILHPENTEARIEIIPLIDIMFFLLAAFMLVSLSLVKVSSVKVNLPTAATASSENRHGLAGVTVDRGGAVCLDGQPVGHHELAAQLNTRRKTNTALRVLISGDRDARHGDVVRVLDLVRGAGIEKVAIDIRPSTRP